MKKIYLIQATIILFFAAPAVAQLVKMQSNVNKQVRANTMSFVAAGIYFVKVKKPVSTLV